MRKILNIYLLYTLQISFIGIFVLVMFGYNLQVTEKTFLENRMFSENVSGIQLSDYRVHEDVDLKIPYAENSDFMMYRYLVENSGKIVRGVYETADVFGFSNYISEGRFFELYDFEDKTYTAVVGQEILVMTIEVDGVRYYPYNQNMYEVIGVFKETETDLDKAVYLNLTRLLEDEDNIGLYYIDAENEEAVNAVITAMKSDAEGKYSTTDIKYEPTVTYGLSIMFNTLLIFSVLAAIFSLFITTIFFVTNQKYTVAVQKLCGLTKKDLAITYGIKNTLVAIFSMILIITAMLFLTQNFDKSIFSIKTLTYHHYIITAISLLMLNALITFFTVRLAEGINISDAVKGR